MSEREDYVDLALAALRTLARTEIAFTMSEAEARLSESPSTDSSRPTIDPHHLTTARRMLTEAGLLDSRLDRGWGGHEIEIYHTTEAKVAEIDVAASKKRAANAQFLGWALGSKRHPNGLLGPAAESAVDAALAATAPVAGYRRVPRSKAGVEELFKQPVPYGPLDNAAHLVMMDDEEPTGVATLLIEVKNLRDWIYPNSPQLYQLLSKACALQRAQPDRNLVPVIVCRRAHFTTYKMAKNLGFYVIEARTNFLKPTADVDEGDVANVREVLGFFDLMVADRPGSHVLRQFEKFLPRSAARTAAQWKCTVPVVYELDILAYLRRPNLEPRERAGVMEHLRAVAYDIKFTGRPGGW